MDLDARWPERGPALTWAPYGPERCCGAFRRYYGALHRASDGPEVLPSNNLYKKKRMPGPILMIREEPRGEVAECL
jgi:hypothetical protein